MASLLWMKSWRISFIIIWNVMGELHSLKNMTVGSNSPQLVQNAAFHSSPSLICMLLNPHLSRPVSCSRELWCGSYSASGVGHETELMLYGASATCCLAHQ